MKLAFLSIFLNSIRAHMKKKKISFFSLSTLFASVYFEVFYIGFNLI